VSVYDKQVADGKRAVPPRVAVRIRAIHAADRALWEPLGPARRLYERIAKRSPFIRYQIDL